jgi:C4-type Zn-finger protein
MIGHKSTIYAQCPKCGGTPTVKSAGSGVLYYAVCSACGFELDDVHRVETTAPAALYHWRQAKDDRLSDFS